MSSSLSNLTMLPFFFQAEDGIRDLYVTGVQTCALPIYRHGGLVPEREEPAAEQGGGDDRAQGQAARTEEGRGGGAPAGAQGRSEERRVGKECRSRWSP